MDLLVPTAQNPRDGIPSRSALDSQNSKYKLEGKILHQQCNHLFPARCQTYAN